MWHYGREITLVLKVCGGRGNQVLTKFLPERGCAEITAVTGGRFSKYILMSAILPGKPSSKEPSFSTFLT